MNTTAFTPTTDAVLGPPGGRAVLDEAHVGDIHGALGTLAHSDRALAAAGAGSWRCSRSWARG